MSSMNASKPAKPQKKPPAKPVAKPRKKAAAKARGSKKATPSPGEIVRIEHDEVVATLPEGTTVTLKLPELVERMTPRMPDSKTAVLSDGVKCLKPLGNGVAVVHQTPPQVYQFEWIRDDSESAFGPGTTYRTVRLSLPYVIVVAYFVEWLPNGGVPMLSRQNQCFFSNHPLELHGLDTSLAYPALLNCSKLACEDNAEAGLLSWICTQHLPGDDFAGRDSLDASLRDGLRALLRHLFESGFNRSSEEHEGASGFSATVEAGLDPRVASVEAWQAATREDPLFALDVPWLTTGCSLGELLERFERSDCGGPRRIEGAADLARMVVHAATAGEAGKRRARKKAARKKSLRKLTGTLKSTLEDMAAGMSGETIYD